MRELVRGGREKREDKLIFFFLVRIFSLRLCCIWVILCIFSTVRCRVCNSRKERGKRQRNESGGGGEKTTTGEEVFFRRFFWRSGRVFSLWAPLDTHIFASPFRLLPFSIGDQPLLISRVDHERGATPKAAPSLWEGKMQPLSAAAAAPGGDGATTRRPDSAMSSPTNRIVKASSHPPPAPPPPSTTVATTTTETATTSASSFLSAHRSLLLLAFLLGVLCSALSFPLLPLIFDKITPAVTPATLPPRLSMPPALKLVAAADGLSRALTPPNLRVMKELAGAWHAAQVRTAAELRLADFLSEEEERARRECLFAAGGSSKGKGGVVGGRGGALPPSPPSLGRRLSCSLRLCFLSPPSLTSRQLARLAVPRCRGIDEAAHASEAAAFAEGSVLPREPPLAGCEGVARRVERLLRALSAYGMFEGEVGTQQGSTENDDEGSENDDAFLSTRWRNSRPSRFLAASHPHSLRAAVLMMTREGQWGAWGRLPLAIATGRPSFVDPGRMGSKGDAAVEALMTAAVRGGGEEDAGGGVAGACPSSNSSTSSSSSSSALPPAPPSTNQGDGKYHPPDDYWHYLESDPTGGRARTFDAAMVQLNRASASARSVAEDAPFASLWAAAPQKPWGTTTTTKNADAFAVDVIDVGGGAGERAAEVLRRHAGVVGRAVVVDLPRVAARARRAWACAAAAANSSSSSSSSTRSSSSSSSSGECPSSLLSLAPHALTYPNELRGRISFSEGTMFSSKSLSAAVERGLGSFAEEEEEEDGGAAAAAAARGSRRRTARKDRKSPRRVQPRRRRLFLLREVIHDWGDAETVKILTALRKSMGSAEDDGAGNQNVGDDGRASHHYRQPPPHPLFDRDDRVLIVGRSPSERAPRGPLAFVESQGAQDADLLMLAVFGGGGAGERTPGQTRALLEKAGLELVAVHPTRTWFSVTEARVKKN